MTPPPRGHHRHRGHHADRQRRRRAVGRRPGRPVGGPRHRPLRRQPLSVADRRPGRRLRSGRPPRRPARAASRPLQRALGGGLAHGVRGRRARRGARRCDHRRLDRLGARRRRLRRGAACRLRRARRARRGAHPRPRRLRRRRREQRGARPRPDRSDGRQRELLRVGRGGDRPGVRRHPRRNGRRRAGGWGRGAARAAHLRRLRHDPRPLAAQRRAVPRLASLRSRPRRLRDGRGCRGAGARGARRRPCGAARGSWPRSSGSAPATTRTT